MLSPSFKEIMVMKGYLKTYRKLVKYPNVVCWHNNVN